MTGPDPPNMKSESTVHLRRYDWMFRVAQPLNKNPEGPRNVHQPGTPKCKVERICFINRYLRIWGMFYRGLFEFSLKHGRCLVTEFFCPWFFWKATGGCHNYTWEDLWDWVYHSSEQIEGYFLKFQQCLFFLLRWDFHQQYVISMVRFHSLVFTSTWRWSNLMNIRVETTNYRHILAHCACVALWIKSAGWWFLTLWMGGYPLKTKINFHQSSLALLGGSSQLVCE